MPVDSGPTALPLEGIPTPTGEDLKGEEDAEAAAALVQLAAADAEPVPEGFCIQYTIRKVRRLHFVGSCKKVPGEHCVEFDCWGDLMPPEFEFDVVCDVCFKGGLMSPVVLAPDDMEDEVLASSSSSSASSSESDSDVETGPAVKRRKY